MWRKEPIISSEQNGKIQNQVENSKIKLLKEVKPIE